MKATKRFIPSFLRVNPLLPRLSAMPYPALPTPTNPRRFGFSAPKPEEMPAKTAISISSLLCQTMPTANTENPNLPTVFSDLSAALLM